MQARTYNVLAVALGAALLSPLAMAQQPDKAGPPAVRGNAAAQVTQSVPNPPDVAAQARDVVPDAPVPAQEVPENAGRIGPETEFAAQVRAQQRNDATSAEVDAEVDADAGVAAGSPAQTRAAAPSKVARDAVFGTLDSDGDGSISSTEAATDADFQARFGTIDADGDGIVTEAEYRAFALTQVPPAPPAQAQGAANAAGHSSVVQRSTFAALDSDADGRISATEAAADADFNTGFAMMDGDGDGFVSDTEFRAHAKAGHHDAETETDTDADPDTP